MRHKKKDIRKIIIKGKGSGKESDEVGSKMDEK